MHIKITTNHVVAFPSLRWRCCHRSCFRQMGRSSSHDSRRRHLCLFTHCNQLRLSVLAAPPVSGLLLWHWKFHAVSLVSFLHVMFSVMFLADVISPIASIPLPAPSLRGSTKSVASPSASQSRAHPSAASTGPSSSASFSTPSASPGPTAFSQVLRPLFSSLPASSSRNARAPMVTRSSPRFPS